MTIPSVSDLRRPILEYASENGEVFSNKQLVGFLKDKLSIDDNVLEERSESGRKRFMNRLGFATHNLKNAGLLHSPQRGRFIITQNGSEFIKTHQGHIEPGLLNDMARAKKQQQDIEDNNSEVAAPITHLKLIDRQDGIQYLNPTFMPYSNDDEDIDESNAAPDEIISRAYQQLQTKLVDDMLDNLKSVDPYQFERIVLALLEKMGYGTGRQVGRSGDGGIDGVINQDPLGLEKVYIQAKRWQNTVGDPEIRNFSGSLMARGASKGVFITTSNFSGAARQTAQTISTGNQQLIRLINGQELARLMVEHGVGVVTEITYEVKKLDENYFSDSDDI